MPKRPRPSDTFLDIEAQSDAEEQELETTEDEPDFFDDSDAIDPSPHVLNPPPSSVEQAGLCAHDDNEALQAAEAVRERFRMTKRRERGEAPLQMWMLICSNTRLHLRTQILASKLQQPSMVFCIKGLTGRIYIQCATISEVDQARQKVPGLCHGKLVAVPFEDQRAVLALKEQEGTIPRFSANDWVRLRGCSYAGDLGRVRVGNDDKCDEGSNTVVASDTLLVAVVPRMHLDRTCNELRPPQVLFDPEEVRKMYPDDVIVQTGSESFKFRGRSYVNGLVLLKLSALHHVKRADPHLLDIGLFAIPEKNLGLLALGDPLVRAGDVVDALNATYMGTTGTVTSVNDKSVVVRNLVDARGRLIPGPVNLSIYEVRRVLKPGHYVTIRLGANAGQSGLIMSFHDNKDFLSIANEDGKVFDAFHKFVESAAPDMNHALPRNDGKARIDENIFDRYRHKRVFIRANRNYCGRYGYVTATNFKANTAWVSIDGTLDHRIVTIPLEHLVCTDPIFCLDESKPLSASETHNYKLAFATIGESSRRSEDIPRNVTPPPPLDDTSYVKPWILSCPIQRRFATHTVFFERGSTGREAWTTLQTIDSEEHSRCSFAHNKCQIHINWNEHGKKEKSGLHETAMLGPWRPMKKKTAIVIRDVDGLPLGSITTVQGFNKRDNKYVSVNLKDENGTLWKDIPLDSVTKAEPR